MRAAVFNYPNNISVNEIQYPTNKNNEEAIATIIKVNACAVCGYDVRVFRNGHSKVTPPVILGHEICGEILKPLSIATANEKSIKAGTRVAICPIIPCLHCYYCNSKQYNLCINLKEIGSTVNGGFAEYIKIPKQTLDIGGLIPIPDSLSDEEAALLEPLACCLNGFSRMGSILNEPGRVGGEGAMVIIGDGPIGLLHLQLTKKLFGIKSVIVVGKVPARIRKAKSMGADEVLLDVDSNNSNREDRGNSNNKKKILELTNGIGANLIIVATSDPAALDLALKVASKNSKINIFAGMPKGAAISLDPNWLHYNQISIIGSFSSTPAMLQKAVRYADNKQVDLSKIVTHQYSLDNIEEALLATERYYKLRVVINKF